METKHIIDIKVIGLEKNKKDISGKRYEFVLQVKWSNGIEALIYRPLSMFFDFQAVLVEMFKHYKIPSTPGAKFHWSILRKIGHEKECKSVEEFCQKIIHLPTEVSQASMVLHFFDQWGTDTRTNDERGLFETNVGRSSIKSIEERRKTLQPSRSSEQEEQFRVIADYAATNLGEVSLKEGKLVTIVEKNEKGWWFVANGLGNQGWAPATHLEPITNEGGEFSYDWISIVDANGKGEMYRSIVAYESKSNDEISYSANEEIEVMEKSNYGWWRVRYQGKTGVTPATNLQRLNDECVYEMNEIPRAYSISSLSGLYAVIRKPPPRRESVKSHSSSSLTNADPGKKSRFVYSTTSFSGGNFVLNDSPDSDVKDASAYSTTRRASADDILNHQFSSYENVETKDGETDEKVEKITRSKSTGNMNGVTLNEINGVKEEFYTATLDYFPEPHQKDNIPLTKGDVLQFISEDSGWMYVMVLEKGNNLRGWVPKNYLERKPGYMPANHSKDAPKPRPRPRPVPRPRDQPQPKPSPPARKKTPPTPPLRHHDKRKEEMKNRLPLPTPLLSDIQKVRKYDEDIYDKPVKLRSVYDSERWYYGGISRADSERILSTFGHQQEFLVRESHRAPGSYAISVKYCYRINHFPIEARGNDLIIGTQTFQNLMDIVAHYKKNPLFYSENQEPIMLGQCLAKEQACYS